MNPAPLSVKGQGKEFARSIVLVGKHEADLKPSENARDHQDGNLTHTSNIQEWAIPKSCQVLNSRTRIIYPQQPSYIQSFSISKAIT